MKFTREQLNREIVRLRESEPENVVFKSVLGEWALGGNGGYKPRHNYLSDANAMLELFYELPDVEVKEAWEGDLKIYECSFLDVTSGSFERLSNFGEELPEAVALSWFQHKTGEVVELEEGE